MSKYGTFLYRGAYYGEIPRLPFSVEPFQAVAVDYDKVLLSWGPPQGALNGLRLVRNQTGFGEWPEDGVVLFEINSDGGDFGDSLYIDGEDNFADDDLNNDIPLTSGRFVYYRMWVRRSSTNLWTPAESIVVVLPEKQVSAGPEGQELSTTFDATLNMLPRIYTSATGEPLDPVDKESDLAKFMEAFSFSYDEMLTFIKLLLPDYSGRNTNPSLLNLQTRELGLNQEDNEFVIQQKRMVREAIFMYSRKGTERAISVLVEALTGFAPNIETSKNLLLSNQDSTFNDSLGFWRMLGDASLESSSEVRPPSGQDKSIETDYAAKVDVNTPGARMINGDVRTLTRGIPVNSGDEYTFSFFAQSADENETVTVKPSIYFYDSGAKLISKVEGDSENTSISWGKLDMTAEAPGKDYLVTDYSVSNSEVILTTDTNHSIVDTQKIKVLGLGIPYDGTFDVDSVTSNTITYTIEETVITDSGTGLEAAVSTDNAVYAALEIEFESVGLIYIDLVQLALSTETEYNEARGVEIFLNPSKSNFVNNPTFSGVTQQWSISGGTASYEAPTAPYLYVGDSMLQVTLETGVASISDTTNTGGMPAGKFYTFSTYVQCSTGTEDVYLSFTCTDSVNPNLTFTADPTTVDDEWVRLSVTGYIPSEFVEDSMFFEVSVNIDNATNGNVLNLEAAQLEPAFLPSLYIDGTFPPEYGIVWEGTPNNSRSHLYKNKQQKIIRLIQELEKFLPSNTPYVVESFGGIETKAITF